MAGEQDISPQRKGQYLYETLRYLGSVPDGAPPRAVFDALRRSLSIDGIELKPYDTQPGIPRYETIARFMTLRAVKAEWMTKQDGIWTITEAGKTALVKYQDSESLRVAASQAYKSWRRVHKSELIEAAVDGEAEAESSALSTITLDDARDRAREAILAHIRGIGPYDFQAMVAALLKAMGYYISSNAAPGKDRGIDIVAYKDPLGAELPRLKVQVKHTESPTGRPDIQKFFGAIGHDDIGIFVSSGGFSGDAKDEVRSHPTAKVTLVDFSDLLKLWVQFYDEIQEVDKHFLRLEPVYFLTS